MIRVLFFDLDETLVAQERAFTRAYRSTAEWFASVVDGVDVEAFSDRIPLAAEASLRASPAADIVRRCCFGGRDLLWGTPGADSSAARVIAASVRTFRKRTWASLVEGIAADEMRVLTELEDHFREAMFAAIAVFPGVLSALERLSKHYRLAAITNGMGAAQREKMAYLGIDGFFEGVIASTDVGLGKPASPIFETALRAMRVNASEALMVGDSLEGDVWGARRVGIATAWLAR